MRVKRRAGCGPYHVRLESRLTSIRNRMDSAYVDKLDGKIPEDFWERKMTEWRTEEQQVKSAMVGLASTENTDRALNASKCSN